MIRDRLWFSGRPASQNPNVPLVSPGNLLFIEGRLKIRLDNGTLIDYPPFCHHSARIATDKINIFLILLNAHSKFEYHERHFGLGGLSPQSRQLIDLTNEIVEAIYFVPVPADKKRVEEKELAEARQQSKRKAPTDGGLRKSARLTHHDGPSSAAVSENQADNHQDSQTFFSRSTSPTSEVSTTNSGYYSSQDLYRDTANIESDPTDDEYGLTHEEMDILEARMADPNLTAKERAAAGMMFMYGNKSESVYFI